MSLKDRWKVLTKQRPWRKESVAITPDSLTVRWDTANGRSGLVELEWTDIVAAVAFKRDLLTTDMICLRFQCSGTSIVVHEEMNGWDELLSALPQHLPGCMTRREIYDHVMKPPFEARETEVFRATSHAV